MKNRFAGNFGRPVALLLHASSRLLRALLAAVLAVCRARLVLARGPGRRGPGQRRARLPEPVRRRRREHIGTAADGAGEPAHRGGQGRLPGPGGGHLPAGRPGRDHGAVAEAGRLRQLPRYRAVARLRAAAAHRDAERVRVQLAGPLRCRGLPGARRAAHRRGRASGLVTAARNAVLALAARLRRPAHGARRRRRRAQPGARDGGSTAAGTASGPACGGQRRGGQRAVRQPGAAHRGRSRVAVVLAVGVGLAGALVRALRAGRWGAWRRGTAWLPRPRPPRVKIPGTWLAGGFVGLAVVATVVHAVAPHVRAASGSACQGQRGAGERADGQPEPRPGGGPVRPRARLHAHRPVRPAGVAERLPRQGRSSWRSTTPSAPRSAR